MLQCTALPSSACEAYRMNFNDNFDIFCGAENCFNRMESTDPGWELRCYATINYVAFRNFL